MAYHAFFSSFSYCYTSSTLYSDDRAAGVSLISCATRIAFVCVCSRYTTVRGKRAILSTLSLEEEARHGSADSMTCLTPLDDHGSFARVAQSSGAQTRASLQDSRHRRSGHGQDLDCEALRSSDLLTALPSHGRLMRKLPKFNEKNEMKKRANLNFHNRSEWTLR